MQAIPQREASVRMADMPMRHSAASGDREAMATAPDQLATMAQSSIRHTALARVEAAETIMPMEVTQGIPQLLKEASAASTVGAEVGAGREESVELEEAAS